MPSRSTRSLSEVDRALKKAHPNATPHEIANMRDEVLSYVSERIAEGSVLATVRTQGDKTVLTVLRFLEEEPTDSSK